MIQRQLKLRLSKTQEKQLQGWLWNLTSVWNWAVNQIGQNAKDKIYFSEFYFINKLAGTSKRLEIPSHTLQEILKTVWRSWDRCFKKTAKKPRFKGVHRKLTSIPFPDPIKSPNKRIQLPIIGKVKFCKQDLPKGKIKCGRIIKRASGWYISLSIDTTSKPIKRKNSGAVGIDPGFSTLLTLSNGEKFNHPRELEAGAKRLAQFQRGNRKLQAARHHERIANQKKDRNHKLSYDLVSRFTEIYFSKDNIKGIATKFGKSVSSSATYQLRQMLKYKSPISGTKYVEVDSKFTTRICSTCRSLTGPTGWGGLKVRCWECTNCGVQHDRDVNAAINTLNAGVGRTLEVGVA